MIAFVNGLLLLLCAPLWQGLVNKIYAILSGGAVFPIFSRWREIIHQCRRQCVFSVKFSFYLSTAFLLTLSAGYLIPFFILPAQNNPVTGLLDIATLLLIAQFYRYMLSSYKWQDILYLALMIVAFVILEFLTNAQTIGYFLLHHRHYQFTNEQMACYLVAVIFILISFLSSSPREQEFQFSGLLLALLTWVDDCLHFCWIVLACDFLWPASLALPLGVVQGDQWFFVCLKSLLACLIKFFLSAAFVAIIQWVRPNDNRKRLLGGMFVVLLSVLALCLSKAS